MTKEHYYDSIREEAFPLLPEKMHGVLDLGGGIGRTAGQIKRKFGAENVGVIDMTVGQRELDPDVDFAENANLDDPNAIQAIGEKHGPFSVILCMDILEHLVDPWSCVKALEKHLRPDGVVIASIPNISHLSVVVKLALKGEWKLHDSGILDRTHLRFFTRETSTELLQSGALKVDHVESIYVKDWSPVYKVKFLRHIIGERYLAYQYLMRAKRDVA